MNESFRRLSGKSVLVSGAGSGIGRATVLRALVEGARVAAVDRDGKGLDELILASNSSALLFVIQADVSDAASINNAVTEAASHAGGLDVVFANAGIGMDPTPIKLSRLANSSTSARLRRSLCT